MRTVIAFLAQTSATLPLGAEVITDGAAGPAGQLAGLAFNIPESLGTVRGGNLLHSFGRFNIGIGESATFTTTSTLDNVIARVTGGEASLIEGLVRLVPASGAPAFFLINPAGLIVSGQGALDVPGSLHLSAADSLRFSDGSVLPMTASGASTLSIASPESFGFLPGNAGFIGFVDGALVTAPGPLLTLDAAGVLVQRGVIAPAAGSGALLRVTATGSAGGNSSLRDGNETAQGSLLIRPGLLQTLSSSTAAAGDIRLQGGNIEISGPDSIVRAVEDRRQADDSADAIKAAIANTDLSIRDAIRAIERGEFGNERPALVSVTANGRLEILDGARIDADTSVNAVAGAGLVGILVNGESKLRGPASRISALNLDNAAGSGGLIGIEAGRLQVEGVDARGAVVTDPNAYTGIETATTGSGDAGFIFIRSPGAVDVRGNAIVRSETFGAGQAGGVFIDADSVTLDGIDRSQAIFTGVTTSSRAGATGNGGLIAVLARSDVDLRNGGAVLSNTESAGFAGLIGIRAGRDIRIQGGSTIVSDTFGDGSAGRVQVEAGESLQIRDGGLIGSDTSGDGNAGVVAVRGRRLLIDGAASTLFTGLSAEAVAGSGNAGVIVIEGRDGIDIVNGGLVSSSTFTSGKAGGVATFEPSLEVLFPPVVTQNLRVSGSGPLGPSSISARAAPGSTGRIGNILLATTQGIQVSDGGVISIENAGSGAGPVLGESGVIALLSPAVRLLSSPSAVTTASFGNLPAAGVFIRREFGIPASGGPPRVEAGASRLLFMDDSRILTEATDGNGGFILVESELAMLQNSSITTSVTGTRNGNGGDISLFLGTLVLDTGFVQANTSAPAANGGFIGINARELFVSSQSLLTGGSTPATFLRGARGLNVIQAAAPDGVNGEIVLKAPPTIDVTGSLLALQAPRIGDVRIGRDPCDRRSGSSLVVFGRGGPPCSPFDPLRQR